MDGQTFLVWFGLVCGDKIGSSCPFFYLFSWQKQQPRSRSLSFNKIEPGSQKEAQRKKERKKKGVGEDGNLNSIDSQKEKQVDNIIQKMDDPFTATLAQGLAALTNTGHILHRKAKPELMPPHPILLLNHKY